MAGRAKKEDVIYSIHDGWPKYFNKRGFNYAYFWNGHCYYFHHEMIYLCHRAKEIVGRFKGQWHALHEPRPS